MILRPSPIMSTHGSSLHCLPECLQGSINTTHCLGYQGRVSVKCWTSTTSSCLPDTTHITKSLGTFSPHLQSTRLKTGAGKGLRMAHPVAGMCTRVCSKHLLSLMCSSAHKQAQAGVNTADCMCAAHLTVALVPQSKLKQSLLAAVSWLHQGREREKPPPISSTNKRSMGYTAVGHDACMCITCT